jgi:hypothetical protein
MTDRPHPWADDIALHDRMAADERLPITQRLGHRTEAARLRRLAGLPACPRPTSITPHITPESPR